MAKSMLLFFLALAVCSGVSAVPLYVSASGQFSSTDVAGQLVAPNGLFRLMFAVDSSQTPLSGTVTTTGFDVPVAAFSYSLNGSSINAAPSEIRFNTLANGGLFDVTFGSGLSAAQFSFQGAQIFSGTTAAPTFAIGSYALTSWTYSDAANFDTRTPTGAASSVSAVPEPSSIFLTLGGLGTFLVALKAVPQRWNR